MKKQLARNIAITLGIVLSYFMVLAMQNDTAFWRGYQKALRTNYSTPVNISTYHCYLLPVSMTGSLIDNYGVPSSAVTITVLSDPQTSLYTDSICESPITEIPVAAGEVLQWSKRLYMMTKTPGDHWLQFSAPGYRSTAVSINSGEFVWSGASGVNLKWTNPANWFGGIVPGPNDVGLFNNTCINCNVVIDSNVVAGGIRTFSNYPASATITQVGGSTITLNNLYAQASGNFVGGSGQVTARNGLIIDGGTFLSTTGKLQLTYRFSYDPNWFRISAAASFNHNNGLVELYAHCALNKVIISPAVIFKHLQTNGGCPAFDFQGSSVNVEGDLTLGLSGYGGEMNNVTFLAQGNVRSFNTSVGNPGGWRGTSSLIKLIGNPSSTPQVISALNPTDALITLEIDTGTKPVVISGDVPFGDRFIVTTVGTLTTTGSTLRLASQNTCANPCLHSMEPAGYTLTYNNVLISGYSFGPLDFQGQNFRIAGNLTLMTDDSYFVSWNDYGRYNYNRALNNGNLLISGNVLMDGRGNFADGAWSGTALVKMVGNPSGQSISVLKPTVGYVPNLEIAAGVNNVTMNGRVGVLGDYTYTSGNLVTTGSTLQLSCTIWGRQTLITPGAAEYSNVSFHHSWGYGCDVVGNFKVNGDLNLIGLDPNSWYQNVGNNKLNGGPILLKGNYISASPAKFGGAFHTWNGNLAIHFVGASQQQVSITGPGPTNLTGNILVNNTAGVTMSSNVDWDNFAGQSLSLLAGNLEMSGYSLQLNASPSLNGNSINKSAGALTLMGVPVGSGPMFGGFVNP